jgi:acetyltransferase-like isoleucine patch superfamily enzyme
VTATRDRAPGAAAADNAGNKAAYIHPLALCESMQVGPRTRIWAFTHVMAGAVIGADCNLGDHAFIESGARLGNGVTVKNGVAVWDRVRVEDDVFIGPSVAFTNDLRPRAKIRKTREGLVPTVLRSGASIGANATIVCGVVIGAHAFVGAGAVVTRDVPDYALVTGNPARQRGWVCRCGRPLRELYTCECGLEYALTGEPPLLRELDS